MAIYTKRGDKGETSIIGGERVSKANPRVEAYGSVDELNASIGLAISLLKDEQLKDDFIRIQHDVMLICTVLATPVEKRKPESPSLSPEKTTALEKLIDNYENEIPKLKNFILPGGSPGAAALHFAGTVCRRAERRMVKLSEETEISKEALSYINRLSDLLFVAGRLANHRAGAEEILWRI